MPIGKANFYYVLIAKEVLKQNAVNEKSAIKSDLFCTSYEVFVTYDSTCHCVEMTKKKSHSLSQNHALQPCPPRGKVFLLHWCCLLFSSYVYPFQI